MFIPLPNLDDRRWADLAEEGRALIPVYAPSWTDHNVHDPGITLVEMLAWVAEMDIFQLNQVTQESRWKFLALVGLAPEPPHAARTVLGFKLKEGRKALKLPPNIEFEGDDPTGQPSRFRTLRPLTVVPGELKAVCNASAKGSPDPASCWGDGEAANLFGEDPAAGTMLYLGFSLPLPPGEPVSLYFTLADDREGGDERARLVEERASDEGCGPHVPVCAPEGGEERPKGSKKGYEQERPVPAHHSVRTVWEFRPEAGAWQVLDATSKQVVDDTRAFTLNGQVVVRLPAEMAQGGPDPLEPTLYYLRCRIVAGAYDAAPRLRNVSFNAVEAEQAVRPDEIAPVAGVDKARKAELLGFGEERPWQRVETDARPVVAHNFHLYTVEKGQLRHWTRRADLDASGRTDAHYTLDAATGAITFGDGENGRTVQQDVPIVARYMTTRAEAGNLAANTINRLSASPHNNRLLAYAPKVRDALAAVTNPVPAAGGRAAETLTEAEGRAANLMSGTTRPVTLADYEMLAMQTPGVRLARASARAGVHPAFPCFQAPGMVAVLVLPYLPAGRPSPSDGLRQAVAAYLRRRRPVGTRVEVFGPTYREVAVRATVQSAPGMRAAGLGAQIAAALDRFFDPLSGGPDGTGWPFGRDVYRSEVMQVVTQVEGVGHVLSLELIADGCSPQCGNVCLGPTGLVAAGKHEITVR
jgi:predicted phage baseplate assembly protein